MHPVAVWIFSAHVDGYLSDYPSLIFGTMAAAGMIKVGALFRQEKLSAWPLSYVLVLSLALAGLALGAGIGHLAGGMLGMDGGVLVGTTAGPMGLALLGPHLGHPDTSIGAALWGQTGASDERIEV
ncbi:MAG: hypothetical protein BRD26_04905 [Bacteroidetes bacterium QH_1_64_81]|nr:MAG: hypothetical protein BRD26_04905 [Bacteroidetes bacterium QH_1_64_81]